MLTGKTDNLPCPFCGNPEISIVEGSTFRWIKAECTDCGASSGEVRVPTTASSSLTMTEARENCIKEWNTRKC